MCDNHLINFSFVLPFIIHKDKYISIARRKILLFRIVLESCVYFKQKQSRNVSLFPYSWPALSYKHLIP